MSGVSMSQLLQEYAQALSQTVDSLLNGDMSFTWTALQQKYLHKIQHNVQEFIQVFAMLDQMPSHDILYTLDHDVRNLITPIMGYVELVQDPVAGDLTQHQRDATAPMLPQVREMLSALEQLIVDTKQQREADSDYSP